MRVMARETKDSGVEWMGQIPAHWQVRSFRYCGVIPNGQVDPRLPQFRDKTLVAPNHIESGTGRLLGTETADEQGAESGKYAFESGNVLYSKIRPELAKVCLIDFPGLCSADMYPIAPRNDVSAGFLAYQMICSGFTESVVLASARVAMPKVNRDELGGIPLVVPPLTEQQAIAAFLDRKTAEIDSLVAKKQRLIERLQEKRQALISHAVTKGLDPNAAMKDSGIEWLGKIPQHWNICRLGYMSNIVRGASPRPAGDPLYFNGNAAPWITVAEVTKDSSKYLTKTSTCLTAEGQALSRLLKSGTFILTNSGATLGVPKIIQIDGCINDGSVAFLSIRKSVSHDYLYYYLSSLTQMLRERASGQGQPNLNTDIVKAIPFPFGPLDEQRRIVAFVEAESFRITNIVDVLHRQIAKLQEYRQTLISAAVTGKIDMTKEAAC